MSEHIVDLNWVLEGDDFDYKAYNREHTWTFKNGESVRASASVDYLGKAECVDPEEAFVASFASCHMLTFLAIASMQGFSVVSYRDSAKGILEKNNQGKLCITNVLLSPEIEFSGDKHPTKDELQLMHDKAHKECFIANSVSSNFQVN